VPGGHIESSWQPNGGPGNLENVRWFGFEASTMREVAFKLRNLVPQKGGKSAQNIKTWELSPIKIDIS